MLGFYICISVAVLAAYCLGMYKGFNDGRHFEKKIILRMFGVDLDD